MQIVKYIAVVVVSTAMGWLCQSWWATSAQSDSTHSTLQHAASKELHKVSKVDAEVPSTVTKTTPESPNPAKSNLNPATFIEDLSVMDRDSFTKYLNGLSADDPAMPKGVLIGVLNELPTITDSKTWYRLIDVLNSSRFANSLQREHVVENWVMEKIQNQDQRAEWLEVVSNLGVWKTDSIEYLAANIDAFHTSESRVSAMLALSRSLQFDQTSHTDTAKESVTNLVSKNIEHYFNSDLELERAAAVSTLQRFPGQDQSKRFVDALDDPSEQVRLSAIYGLMGGKRPNEPLIKDRLVTRMQSDDASDFERLNAWFVLSSFQLEGDHYAAVYDFGVNEKERLTQRFRSGPSRQRSQWGY